MPLMSDPLEIFFAALSFIFGTMIGSFLNVVIHRVPNEESIVFPGSHCPNCSKTIKFYDNIPVIAWLFLGGKCRFCRQPISFRYPSVELLTGLIFLLVWRHDGLSVMLPLDMLFASTLIALIFIDADAMILPNVITYPGIAIAFLARITVPLFSSNNFDDLIPHSQLVHFDDLRNYPLNALYYQTQNAQFWQFWEWQQWNTSLLGAFLGAMAGGGSLWLVGWIWKQLRGIDAMGFGDVKMMFMVGAYLGWRLTILTIFLGALTGALAGIFLVLRQKQESFQAKIPFGIFLGIGSLISLFAGNRIIDWYISNFVP